MSEITMETIKVKIKEIVNNIFYPNDDGGIEIYLDHDDCYLGSSYLHQITISDNPREAFLEIISDWEVEYDSTSDEEDIMKRVKREFSDEEIELYEDNYDEIWEWIRDTYYFYYPVEKFDKEVNVNLMLDTGNMNYDFTCDNVLNWDGQYNNGEFDSNSSILWLAKTQKKAVKLRKACKSVFNRDGNYEDSDKFISSVVQELENLPCHMSTLTFLLKMDLFDYFDLREAINAEKELNKSYTYSERKGTGYITVSKDTMCGLFNPWSGNGSMLEIELDKDVEIPFKAIFAVEIETGKSNYGYSVNDVYGLIDSCWKETVK